MKIIFLRKIRKGLNKSLFILLLIIFWVATVSAEVLSSDQWFLVTLAGDPVGYVHETVAVKSTTEGSVILTASEMKMALNRLGTKVEIQFLSSSEETPEGFLKRINYEMNASLMSTKSEALVKGNSIVVRSESGGKSYARTLKFSGELLGPEGIRKISLAGLKKPGDKIEFQTFSPELEAVTKVSRLVLAQETIKISGADIEGLKIEEKMDVSAIKATAWLDSHYEFIKQEMPTPFGVAQILKADKITALKAAAGEELGEEIFIRSVLYSNIRLPKARSLDYLKIQLTHRNPELGWPEIKSPYQKVLSQTRESLILEVSRPYPKRKAAFPVAKTEKNREFLEPNAYLQSDEPEVQSLVHQVIGKEKNIFQAALKLERWVAENMKFDLGIVLAPSSEVFRNRRGTCLGYATLLATLCRAAGIPSRVVMGYVYALGIFGGHAWTEIMLGEEWIPLDAALVAQGPADAARFYFLASSFYGGVGSLSSGAGQQVFGQVDLKILEYQISGEKKVTVKEGSKHFRIEGNIYENPWLGLRLTKPSDFKFTKMDAVWPEPTILVLAGPEGEKIELQQHFLWPWKGAKSSAKDVMAKLNIGGQMKEKKVARRHAFFLEEKDKGALVIIDGLEAWVLAAQGKNASQLLKRIALNFELK